MIFRLDKCIQYCQQFLKLLFRANSLESFYSSNIADRLESLVPNSVAQGDAVLESSIAENENNINEQQSIMKGTFQSKYKPGNSSWNSFVKSFAKYHFQQQKHYHL